MPINRRHFLNGFAYGSLGGVASYSGLLKKMYTRNDSESALLLEDAFDRLLLGTQPAMAMPSDTQDCIITIKVMNLIHTPLCFKFPNYTGSQEQKQYKITMRDKIKKEEHYRQLEGKGIERLSDNPRFAALKLNQWWASILDSGLDESGQDRGYYKAGEIGAFPSQSEVALQAALHLNQNNIVLNHSFRNTCLLESADAGRGGDINYHCHSQGLINSPFGMSCLTMGNSVETTDGMGRVSNRILANDLKSVSAIGKSVEQYVDIITQSIGTGFINEEMRQALNDLIQIDTSLVNSILKNRENLSSVLKDLQQTSAVEEMFHTMPSDFSGTNIQGFSGGSSTARSEFISQCLFVSRALNLPDKPLRNFSLLLNIFDVDGQSLDVASKQGNSQPYSNVEGMRQLAIGMNILAQSIKKHRNVYVVVVSEGGRGANSGDNKVGHAFLMGPGGSGNLKDYLYANKTAVNDPKDTFVADPNEGGNKASNSPGLTDNGAGLRLYDDKSLRSFGGFPVTDSYAKVADFLHGVLRHIESKRGLASTTQGLDSYVKIQTS